MSIHCTVIYREQRNNRFLGPPVTIVDRVFEKADVAIEWYMVSGYKTDSQSAIDVIQAAENEYVGVELELLNSDGTGYSKCFLCIEGEEGTETFQHRHKDLIVDKFVTVVVDGKVITHELYGCENDGKKVWIMAHVTEDTEYKTSHAHDD